MAPNPERADDPLAAELEQARNRLRRNHRVRSGKTVSLRYSEDIDRLLQGHARAVVAANPAFADAAKRMALCAVGGYGRRELNLYSDIDILFVLNEEPTPGDEEFIKAFLYPLWNLRVDLGYSVKSIDQAVEEIGQDLDLTTSLFTMHPIWGNHKFFMRLRERLRVRVGLKYETSLSEEIIKRLEERHERFGKTCLLLEPHLKEAPGGLRDIHVLCWLGFINFGDQGLHSLTAHGLLTSTEERQLRRSLSFLMELRDSLHILDGRKTDVLSIERQIRIAPTMGIKTGDNTLPEEQLMRKYYQHATVVDRIARRVVRLFRARRMQPRVTGKARLRARRLEGIFQVRDNQIGVDPAETSAVTRDSYWMMQLFTASALYDHSIDDFTLDLVTSRLTDIDEGFRRSAINRDRFLFILSNRRTAARTLRLMHHAHFLDAYIPEFAPVRNLPRIDHYHQFTVDEHMLRAVECATEFFRDGSGHERGHASGVAREILRWDLLVFAVLVHDIGKGEGRSHVIRGAHIVQRICERLGLTRKETRILHDLVLHHQRMSHLALRRNPDDPIVPRELVRDIADPEVLRMLYVLTCSDLRAVSRESWNDWRASLLAALFERTMDCLLGKDDRPHRNTPSHDELSKLVIDSIEQEADDDNDEAEPPEALREHVESLLADLPDRYRQTTPPPIVARHLKLARRVDDKTQIAWDLETMDGRNYAFLHCVVRDSPGLFANLCGALASRRLNILSAQIFTARNGVCIDVFQIQDVDNQQPRDREPLERVFAKLNETLRQGKQIDWVSQMSRNRPPISPARLEIRPPQVNISNDESGDGYTLLEVRAPDRPGLLYAITSVLDKFRINIHLALVATESYQIVDVFYVTDWEHNRLEAGPQSEKLRKALLDAVSPAPEHITT
ncbi:MAG: [protein-PII] uridylyltransferase [Candidatus Sumerlaeota bacterium]|nr:[protein-PII] uridylyltransferase [Candidatus Sumerlaeota bacterium]